MAVRWTVGVLLVVLILGLLGLVLYRQPALALVKKAREGKEQLAAAKASLESQQFAQAETALTQAVVTLKSAQTDLRRLRSLKWVPVLGSQVSAAENLLQVAVQTGEAAASLSGVADRVTEPLHTDGTVSFGGIPAEKKRAVLELLSQTEPELQGAKAQIDLAATYLAKIPERGLIGPLRDTVTPLREQIPTIQTLLERSLPTVRVLPGILGYPEKRSYLFLLQNNTELRPTGGFIGSYGIVNFSSAEIASFSTHNVYDLDIAAEPFLYEQPPDPLRRYVNINRWFFRDANWSPDFPTSAREVLRFYDLEKQAPQRLDGVIAVTPVFIASLLKVTGPITVNGITFDANNLVDKLQYEVEIAYAQKGQSDSQRKEIIGHLAQQLYTRMLAVPQKRWSELWDILQENVKAKHVLMYLTNADEESYVQDLGWAGEVKAAEQDYLFVVDANMASLKSDPGVQREMRYTVAPDGDSFIATLSVRYNNQGTFNWKSTRYRTFTRIYVPKGSELLSSSGYLLNDKLQGGKETQAAVAEELGKTVFTGFTSIEPQEERTLELRYRLPADVAQAIRDRGEYALFVQKQPGTDARPLQLDITVPGRLQSYAPEEGATVNNATVTLNGTLDQDRTFTATFRP